MKTFLSSTAALALLFAAPALAQSQDTGAKSADSGSSADQITCAEITELDTAMIPSVLYFVAGHQAGTDQAKGGSMKSDDTASAKSDASGSANTSAAGSSDMASTGTTAESPDTAKSTDSTATPTDADTGAAADTGDSDIVATDESSDDDVRVVAVRGFYEIPVEETIVACGNALDQTVQHTLKQEKDKGASSSSGDTGAKSTD